LPFILVPPPGFTSANFSADARVLLPVLFRAGADVFSTFKTASTAESASVSERLIEFTRVVVGEGGGRSGRRWGRGDTGGGRGMALLASARV